MLSGSLLAVFVLAKIVVLAGHTVAWSSWTVLAYFWQDVAVAAILAVVERLARSSRQRRATWAGYAALSLYVALNIPVMLVLTTPLTWPMVRATGNTLSDSILLYATPRHVVFMLGTLVAAALVPFALARLHHLRRLALAGATVIGVAGFIAAPRVDSIGLHRNVVATLLVSAWPKVTADAAAGTWDTPPFEPPEFDALTDLRAAAPGRNVVLVSLESTAATYLRLYGAIDEVTPHLDRLARHAVVFDRAYAAYPESIKGLFSILCSVFPAFDTSPEVYEQTPCASLPARLAAAGYRTALFHSGRFGYLGMESIVNGRGFDVLADAGDIGGERESSFGIDEPSTVDRMLSWIDTLPDGERFFLTYLPIAGHHPYEVPGTGPFDGRDEPGRYKNALHYADSALGRLVDGVRARGLEQHTIWIVLGDHGEAFGQHEGNFGHTFFLYEENVHVPFLVAMPGVIGEARRSRTPVSLVDTAPTILELLGLDVPAEYQGRSALSSPGRMTLFLTDYSLPFVGLRDGRWKFIHELGTGRSKLFDLAGDADEQVDIATQHGARVSVYERTLRAWARAQKAHVYSARPTVPARASR